MQKITPFLWFDSNAEEAFALYSGLFDDAAMSDMARYPDSHPTFPGRLMSATMTIGGQRLFVLNGGPMYKFTEAFSLFVNAGTQDEIDRLHGALSDGGEVQPCGWLKDKFGLSWQIIPPILGRYLSDPDPAKAGRVMQAMFGMKKIVIADLEKAYKGA